MKIKKFFSKYNIEAFYDILSSVILVTALVFSLLSLHSSSGGNEELFKTYFAFSFLSISISKIPHIINIVRDGYKNKIAFFKNIAFAVIFLIFFILLITLPFSPYTASYICASYLLCVAGNRICLAFEKRKIGRFIFNLVLAIISISIAVVMFAPVESEIESYIYISLTIIMIVCLAEILVYVFSRMQFKGIIKIMKETYAFEILYGLVILVVSFSVYFYLMEEGIKSFGDALWLSFSIITTIGFGDIVVVSPVSRVLAVILGIYGIIVVALITSVIVNYYNEVKEKRRVEEKQKEEIENNENNEDR